MKKERMDPPTGGIPLQDDVLEQVNGGASGGNTDPELKYIEFTNAWDSIGFPQHGWTVRQKEGLCDQWGAEGFPGTASQWLSRFRNW